MDDLRVVPDRRDACTWTYDGGEGCYQTECGEVFCFNDGTAEENGAHYCHHCGGRVRVVRKCFECRAEMPGEGGDLCEPCRAKEEADDA